MTRITKAPEERRQEIIDTAMKVFYEASGGSSR